MFRRHLLTTTLAAFTLPLVAAGCTGTSSADQFAVAKSYLDAATTAVLAAAQQYLTGSPAPSAANAALVQAAIMQLQAAKAAVDATTSVADWKSGAIMALEFIGQLNPVVGAFLGAAAPYVPLAVAVVTAFINSLPAPLAAPPTPPVALLRKGAEYHPRPR